MRLVKGKSLASIMQQARVGRHTWPQTLTPPLVFRCNPRAKAVMIYPAERTNGNRVYDSAWWLNAWSFRAV